MPRKKTKTPERPVTSQLEATVTAQSVLRL